MCPRCGKYVSEAVTQTTETSEDERELGKNIKFFKFSSLASGFLFGCCSLGVIMLAGGIFFIYDMRRSLQYILEGYVNPFVIRGIILLFSGLVISVFGIIAFLAHRKSFVCINENGVYGIIPWLFIKAERFEFFYEDITDFRCHIPVSKGLPSVRVKADGKVFRILGLDNSDASFVASYIRENIPKKRKRR